MTTWLLCQIADRVSRGRTATGKHRTSDGPRRTADDGSSWGGGCREEYSSRQGSGDGFPPPETITSTSSSTPSASAFSILNHPLNCPLPFAVRRFTSKFDVGRSMFARRDQPSCLRPFAAARPQPGPCFFSLLSQRCLRGNKVVDEVDMPHSWWWVLLYPVSHTRAVSRAGCPRYYSTKSVALRAAKHLDLMFVTCSAITMPTSWH